MCFTIDENAKRPRRTSAYKIVDLYEHSGRLRSAFYPKAGQDWNTPGGIVRRDKGPTKERRQKNNYCASYQVADHGIYVYNNLWMIYPSYFQVILKVLVNPLDWICSSKDGLASTYEKVIIAEDQPEIEWYGKLD